MDWVKLLSDLLSQCGVVSGILFSCLVYQTWQRGVDRERCEKELTETRRIAQETRKTLNGMSERVQQWLMGRLAG